MYRCCRSYGWTVDVCSKLLVPQKRNDVPLYWYATLVLSVSPSHQILVHSVARMAPIWRADNFGWSRYALYHKVATLNVMRLLMGSQCRLADYEGDRRSAADM